VPYRARRVQNDGMPSSNPALNDKIFEREIRNSYAGAGYPAAPPTQAPPGWQQPGYGAGGPVPPAPDLVSPWTPQGPGGPQFDRMRMGGVLSASAVLLTLFLAAGWFGYSSVEVQTLTDANGNEVRGDVSIPAWLLVSWIVGLGLAFLTIFKPKFARVTAPLYALAQGLLVGAITHLYEIQSDGIAIQAVGLTAGVFAMMLFLFATRIIKVTDKLRTGIVAATGAVCVVYLISIVASLFGAEVPFLHESSLIGIGISLVIVGVAAANLLLDFDFIERGIQAGAPRYMEWYAAFGLMMTLIWLYLELLRLLSKLRSR
jgi:uncharacterized YccA/Bax inhibitor family protein